jgi:hypothetical protein
MPILAAPTMPSSPHDALFKASFGQPDIARSELELVLPADVRHRLRVDARRRPGAARGGPTLPAPIPLRPRHLAALSLDSLAARALHALGRLVQLALWSSRSMDRLERAAPLMGAIAGTLVRDARTRALLLQLYAYLWRAAPPDVAAENIRSILLTVAGPQGAEDVVNAAEQLIERGRAHGLEQGEVKGLRAAITHVLAARSLALSELGRARLTSCADVAVLTAWLERAATATSEAEVFAGADGV